MADWRKCNFNVNLIYFLAMKHGFLGCIWTKGFTTELEFCDFTINNKIN